MTNESSQPTNVGSNDQLGLGPEARGFVQAGGHRFAMTKDIAQHILRNPYPFDPEQIRDARLWACDELERLSTPCEVRESLAPSRAEQSNLLVLHASQVGASIEIEAELVGTWYSPAMVREMLADQKARIAALIDARAGLRGTGAWSAITAAADAVREA